MSLLVEQESLNTQEEEILDPNDSEKLCDHSKGQTLIHARPARLEDEGQSGG